MSDVKCWTVFHAARYMDGKLLEELDLSHLSFGLPIMVDWHVYAELKAERDALLKECAQYIEALDKHGIINTRASNDSHQPGTQSDTKMMYAWTKP